MFTKVQQSTFIKGQQCCPLLPKVKKEREVIERLQEELQLGQQQVS